MEIEMIPDNRASARKYCALAALLGTLGFLCIDPEVAAGGSDQIGRLSYKIEQIKTESSTAQRTEYAHQLFATINEDGSGVVDDKTTNDLAMLMAERDDSVRYWIAMSLAKVGLRGKQAVPALENALKRVECTSVSKSSESAIRIALTKMGEHLPKRVCP